MKASLSWWRKGLSFLLRLFFPELSLWQIVDEEILRTRFLKHLHSLGFTTATRQQLMSIQQGKLFVTTSGAAIDYELSDRSSVNKSNTAVATHESTAADEWHVAIRWTSETPKGDCTQLNIANVRTYQHFLASLPTGKQTWKGIGYPDIGTSLLTMQLIWLLITIALRLSSGYKVSLLELYCLFSLVAFVAERVVTQLNVPAWSQQVVVCMESARYNNGQLYSMEKKVLPKTWKEIFAILPMLQFLGWPAFMMIYAFKSGPLDGPGLTSMTNPVCLAAGGVYLSAFIWTFIGSCLSVSKSFQFLSWGPLVIAGSAFFLSKVLVFGLGISQALQGNKDIFLVPVKQWNIPHISG